MSTKKRGKLLPTVQETLNDLRLEIEALKQRVTILENTKMIVVAPTPPSPAPPPFLPSYPQSPVWCGTIGTGDNKYDSVNLIFNKTTEACERGVCGNKEKTKTNS